MEKYSGVKFRTFFLGREAPHDQRIAELITWCKRFDDYGLLPVVEGRSMGNLSFRTRSDSKEFIITASGLGPKDSLTPECFVRVVGCDLEKFVVYAYGLREPSSETMLHYRIYELRQDVNAIFHGHDKRIVQRAEAMSLVVTRRRCPYGSLELIKSVEEVLGMNNFIVLKHHGFLSLGQSMREAGLRALEKRAEAEKLKF